jgi:hypothetical protein
MFLLETDSNGNSTRRVVGYEKIYRDRLFFFELSEDTTQILAYSVRYSEASARLEQILISTDIIFRDPEQKNTADFEFLLVNAMEILLSSPRRPGFMIFMKGLPPAAKLVIPPFFENELVHFGEALGYPVAAIQDARRLFGIFGGVPRYCYEKAYDEDAWCNFIKIFVDRMTQPILRLFSPPAVWEDIQYAMHTSAQFPHRLLFLRPNEQFRLQAFCSSSVFVEELIVLAEQLQEKITALRYLTNEDVARIYWQVFERGCILALTSQLLGTKIQQKQLVEVSNTAGKLTKEWQPCGEFTLPHCDSYQRVDELPPKVTDSQLLLVPLKVNNPSFDAISTKGIFQFTISKQHDLKYDGIQRAVRMMDPTPEEGLSMYWMVPATIFKNGTFTITSTANYVQEINHFMIALPDTMLAEMKNIATGLILEKFQGLLLPKENQPPFSDQLTNTLQSAIDSFDRTAQVSITQPAASTSTSSTSTSL